MFGKNFIILSYTGRECDVAPETETYGAIKNIPIVSTATAWTSLDSTETYILVFNEGLWIQGEMDHRLINPNQMKDNVATVQDNPFYPSPIQAQDVFVLAKMFVPDISKGRTKSASAVSINRGDGEKGLS